MGKKVENWFIENGYDIKSVRNIDPKMTDEEILKIAVLDDRLVITMDKDFGELVYNSRLCHAGVLLLRLEDAHGEEKVRVVEKILSQYKEELYHNFCVYQKGKFRVKK